MHEGLTCKECGGTGHCPKCKGSGQQLGMPCGYCITHRGKCKACRGKGTASIPNGSP